MWAVSDWGSVVLVLTLLWTTGAVAGEGELDFEARVAAQAAIERVYHSHRIDAPQSFEAAVPREVLERKVRAYLAQSAALETRWNLPVTAEALRQELQRIASRTKTPERLRELFAALNDDSVLIQECLVRPVLVDRLAREFFEADERIHVGARTRIDELRASLLNGVLDPQAEHPARELTRLILREDPESPPSFADDARVRTLVLEPNDFARLREQAPAAVGEIGAVLATGSAYVLQVVLEEDPRAVSLAIYRSPRITWDRWWIERTAKFEEPSVEVVADAGVRLPDVARRGGEPCDGDFWDNGALDDLPDQRYGQTAVWTGSEMILWGGSTYGSSLEWSGLRYDPATDAWTVTKTSGAPEARFACKAVWTGNEMIIWGGAYGFQYVDTGGRYDPVADSWSPVSTAGAPTGRWSFTLVWGGDRMIVWGGSNDSGSLAGGRYNPQTNTWQPVTTVGQPSSRFWHSAVWAEDRMIVWGGYSSGASLKTGGRYDPVTDTWAATSVTGAPDGRTYHSAIWTGQRMIVWGGAGAGGDDLDTGGMYDPDTNAWSPTSLAGAPNARELHSAVWTGNEMIVWGGRTSYEPVSSGGRFDPVANTWASTSPAPYAKSSHTAVWTGDEMIVWSDGTGGRYFPQTDSWTTTYTPNQPTPRAGHTAVWTGSEMIVWAGAYERFGGDYYETVSVNSGGAYDPILDAWTPTSFANAPEARIGHTAVWTGTEMIVWGGNLWNEPVTKTGGRYDPIGDTWTPTSLTDAPDARAGHTAVWTGAIMIVWGGDGWAGGILDSGGRYDPGGDDWSSTTLLDAPSVRYGHTAVWTDSRMIVWGGRIRPFPYDPRDTGGLYDPATNGWTSTSMENVPEGRFAHSAVWTGNEMIVWGGENADHDAVDTGGRYDPADGVWRPTSTVDAPIARINHTAVWTGHEMIVWSGGEWPWQLYAGSRYLLREDRWLEMARTNIPGSSLGHTAVWTGERMILWDGNESALGGSYDPDGVDGDSDQVGCVLDCDDADPGVVFAAGTVGGLRFGERADTLLWDSAAAASGPGTVYDIVRGSGTGFPVGSGAEVCVETAYPPGGGTGTITLFVVDEPDPGVLHWYLVRPTNSCGVGTYGTTSAGVTRVSGTCG